MRRTERLRPAAAGSMLVVLMVAACAEAPNKLSLEEYLDRFDDTSGSSKKDVIGVSDVGDSDGGDTSDGSDGVDATDGSDGTGDVIDPPDTGPACVPTGEELCNGLDDDCDGDTDEGTAAVKATVDFKAYTGWARVNPRGSAAHTSGPVPFRGANDADSTVFSRLQPWTGDVELDVRLLLSTVVSDGTWFIGTLSEVPAEQALVGQTGFEISSAGPQQLRVRGLVSGEAVVETTAQVGSFLGVLFRVNTSTGKVLLRLQKGDGSAVAEVTADDVVGAPTHAAIAIAARGAVVGSVSRIDIDGTAACVGLPLPACESCAAAEPCTVAVCNPLFGCDVGPVTCGFSTECADAGVCDVTNGLCPAPTAKAEGEACPTEDRCKTGAVCAAGACVGGTETQCSPEAATVCQDPGSCVAFVGCVYPSKPDGTTCNDDSQCTGPDSCDAGQCVGAPSVTCPSNGACESPSVCDPGTGECSAVAPLDDGAECDDADSCTTNDVCAGGACAGTPKPCDDGNPCTLDACAAGECTNTPSLDCLLFSTAVGESTFAGAPTLVGSNVVLAGPKLWSVGSDGAVVWTAELSAVTTMAVASPNGTQLAMGDASAGAHRLVTVAADTGAVVLSADIPGECADVPNPCRFVAAPTWTPGGGRIYVSTGGAGTFAMEPSEDGTTYAVLWAAPGAGTGARVVASDSGAYFAIGGDTPALVAVDGAGIGRWLWTQADPVTLTPAVGDGSLYVAAGLTLTAATDDGFMATPRWTATLPSPATAEPILLGADRVVTAVAGSLVLLDGAACAASGETCVTTLPLAGGAAGPALAALANGWVAYAGKSAVGFVPVDGAAGWSLPLGTLTATLPVWTGDRFVFGTSDGVVHAAPAVVGLSDTAWPVYGRVQGRNPTY